MIKIHVNIVGLIRNFVFLCLQSQGCILFVNLGQEKAEHSFSRGH